MYRSEEIVFRGLEDLPYHEKLALLGWSDGVMGKEPSRDDNEVYLRAWKAGYAKYKGE